MPLSQAGPPDPPTARRGSGGQACRVSTRPGRVPILRRADEPDGAGAGDIRTLTGVNQDRYGRDVLSQDPHQPRRPASRPEPAVPGLVVEEVETGWVEMTLPAGSHVLVTCADSRQAIAEADEANNCTLRTMQTMGAYDIRYSTDPEAAWDDMTPIPAPPKPLPDGFHETTTITGLDPGTVYYFKMKVCNEAGWSEVSNTATGETEVQE